MRIALYVSNHTPDATLEKLRTMAKNNGWTIAGEYVADPSHPDGDALAQYLQAGHDRQHDAALVWRAQDAKPRLRFNEHRALSAV